MADLVFNKRKGTLTWTTKNLSWKARSGTSKGMSLPNGSYVVGKDELTMNTKHIPKPFQDSSGKGFFVPIYPEFETNRGKVGGRLGIHPDGGLPGTLGCIGLDPASNTTSFYNAMQSSNTAKSLKLTVE